MAIRERRSGLPAKSQKSVKIVDFEPQRLKAPFFLRCVALFIDYMLLLVLPVGWLIWGKYAGDTGPTAGLSVSVWLLGIIVWLSDFVLLPLLRGQTLGKMATGITIVNRDGTDVQLSGILLRNIVGYFITVLTFGIGFLIAGVNSTGRALHDFISGTIVVRGRKRLV